MDRSPIDEIKSRLDIVDVVGGYIKLEKTGVNLRASCPFHSEKTPSFFVSPARQSFKCFGCGKSGDIFTFVQEIEGIEFGDALRMLAKKAGVRLTRQDPRLRTGRERLYEICELSCKFFEEQLENTETGGKVREYLNKRGIKNKSIKEWRLGYSPDSWHALLNLLLKKGYKREEIERAGLSVKSEKGGSYYDRFRARIMFPVFDLNSQIIGFGGRITKEEEEKLKKQGTAVAKYLNVPQSALYNKSNVLYGLNKARLDIRKKNQCVLVEGYTDVIMSHQAGIKNVVAASGTALTPSHLSTLKRYSDNLVLAFDMDSAGDMATKRGIDLAVARGFNIRVALMEEDLDPADVILKKPKQWQESIEKSSSILDFYFETTFLRYKKKEGEELNPDEKKEISDILLPAIKKIPNKILQSHWAQILAGRLKVGQEDVLAELKKVKSLILKKEEKKEGKPVEKTPSPKSRKERLEEYLLTLLLKQPKNLKLITDKDDRFFSPQALQIVSLFRKQDDFDQKKILEQASSDMRDLLTQLLFKSESEEGEEQDFLQEFKDCLREIKMLGLKKELRKIALDLKEAEMKKNLKKASSLTQRFNKLAQELTLLDN